MSTHARTPSEATRALVARAAGDLGAAAVQQMEADHEWYRALSAENRSWVGLVAQAGISSFLDWFGGDQERPAVTADVFGTAPRELTRSISLAQTLDLLRTVIGVVEREITGLAVPGEGDLAREAVLRYSREVAFSAAEVYAQAAEARGAWDARLESLVVDAVIRGEADDSMQSRAAALGWGAVTRVVVVVGSTPPGAAPAPVVTDLHRAARRHGAELLVAIHGPRIICIGGGVEDALGLATALDKHLGDGPLVVGPTVPHLFAAGRSARAAISGHTAAPAWPGAPRPVHADDLLAERALLGDLPARGALVARIIGPLADSPGGTLLETAAAWLDGGQGVEGTARALIVHPNTVRYRLAGITRACGYDLTDPHDADTVRMALAVHRLGPVARATPRA
ncbi:PucR family transcriptional regulator [Oryzobacter sp. R7]|uniref:PucR family transcriptional regulator n=1 Tax=Oryzobacter faecalis TaxID=3388656 RepID=UPI00398D4FAF